MMPRPYRLMAEKYREGDFGIWRENRCKKQLVGGFLVRIDRRLDGEIVSQIWTKSAVRHSHGYVEGG